MSESIQSHLEGLHQLYSDAILDDPQAMRNYVWTVAKQIFLHIKEIDSLTCRQLLADCIKLPIERPSSLYSTLLSAAVKVAGTYPEFRFAAFVRMWGIKNLRPDDSLRETGKDGKSYPSLTERTAKALGLSLLAYPEIDAPSEGTASSLASFLSAHGYTIQQMIVTRVRDVLGRDGRKYYFVTLTSPDGLEIEGIGNKLFPNPKYPLTEGKRHFANVGQLYHCLLRAKAPVAGAPSTDLTLVQGVLSLQKSTDVFPEEVGYIETIDPKSGMMHIYDRFSRHFVAHILRFSREQTGDCVRFFPIIPQSSKFKTAIITAIVPASSDEIAPLLREIRITAVNKDKGYAAWELTDKSHPITEQLSALQLSQGETSPAFTTGYLNLPKAPASSSAPEASAPSRVVHAPVVPPSALTPGQTFRALVYLKRGKDRQKRPHIARLFA